MCRDEAPVDIDPATIDSAAAAIRRYLAEHPGSADTVEGVAEWWLARQRACETLAVVTEALRRLSASGEVRESRTAGGRVIYKLATKDRDG